MTRLVIVGGGIAGLAAAYYALTRPQQPPDEVIILEKDDRWGGKIATDRVDGFVIEGGPDTFIAMKPWGMALARELGIADRLHGSNPVQKNTYILHKGRLLPLPGGLTMMIPTDFRGMLATGLISWPGKVRMGLDFLLPPAKAPGEESLGQFVTRRLGREAYEALIEPLMSGIYAGDGDKLSLQATFPYLRDLEIKHGGLVRGALAAKRERMRKGGSNPGSRSMFVTPKTGLAELVEALVARLGELGAELRLETQVDALEMANAGRSTNKERRPQTASPMYRLHLANGDTLESDRVILATPAYVTARLMRSYDPELAALLDAIPYASTATVILAYDLQDVPRPLDGYGYVIPRREGRRALACTWTSTKFPHRAPEDKALLRVFVGRAGQEEDIEWTEEGLLQIAREELQLTLGITAEPLLTRVFIWPQAMPQYNVGHPARVHRIMAKIEQWPGLALAGNAYHGIGIPDCIHSGEMAVERLFSQSSS